MAFKKSQILGWGLAAAGILVTVMGDREDNQAAAEEKADREKKFNAELDGFRKKGDSAIAEFTSRGNSAISDWRKSADNALAKEIAARNESLAKFGDIAKH